MPKRTVHYLFQLSWGATRQQCPLPPAKMIFTPFTYQLETSTTAFDMHIGMASVFWDFYVYPQVSTLITVYICLSLQFHFKLIENTKTMTNFACFVVSFFIPLWAPFSNPYNQQCRYLKSPNVLMDISVALSMVLAHILPTIQSKFCLQVLFQAGVRSEYFTDFTVVVCGSNLSVARCWAPANDLATQAARRSHDHTDALRGWHSLKKLWDEHGIVGEIVVSIILLFVALIND